VAGTALSINYRTKQNVDRTDARKSSKGELYVCAEGLIILKFDTNYTDF